MAIASALRFAGYAVGICPGPRGHGRCPLTGPDGCAPAHDADVVVCSLDYTRENTREVLRELRTRYPDVPLLVELPAGIDLELAHLADGCEKLPAPATPEQVVAAVRRIAGAPSERGTADA
jgi:DNA-binding NarL/FixJ family response regulator